MDNKYSFDEFCGIIETLRSENGCPWDKVQTHVSLKQCLIEEAYEVLQGIDEYEETKDFDNLREELGDVLLQVVMHSVIAKQEGIFSIEDVIDEIAKKMVRRHPHVFQNQNVDGNEAISQNWDQIKREEKESKNKKDDLASIPSSFPALIRAQKVIKKVNKLNPEEKLVYDEVSIHEKMEIISDEQATEKCKKDALGQAFFELCKLSQEHQLNAEECLSEYVKHFIFTKEQM